MVSNNPRRSAKDALEPDTYYRLYQGALQIDNYERRLIACFVILVAGRLGLRIAEIQHLREEHIHWKRGEICIPHKDPCACYRCWVQALDKWGRKGLKELQQLGEWESGVKWKSLGVDEREAVVAEADYCTPENLADIVYTEKFSPKYDRSARVIAFGWSYRITACLMTFFDEFDCLEPQQFSINRLLKEAADNADGLNPKYISAHRLRATGETFFADISIDPKMLRDLAGWQQMSTGDNYWSKSGRVNTLKLYKIMGRKDEAPPVVPEDPGQSFPIVCNPVPFQNEPFHPIGPEGIAYDEQARLERHREREKKPLRLRHPREVSLPYDRAGFPSPDEIEYDPDKHGIPGHIDPDSDHVAVQTGEVTTTATTLHEFTDHHRHTRSSEPSPGSDRINEYETKLDKFTDKDGPASHAALDVVSAIALATVRTGGYMKERLGKEWNQYWMNEPNQSISPVRAAKGITMYLLGVIAPLTMVFGLMVPY